MNGVCVHAHTSGYVKVNIVLADFAEYIKKICNMGKLINGQWLYMLNFFLTLDKCSQFARFEESHLKGIPKILFGTSKSLSKCSTRFQNVG